MRNPFCSFSFEVSICKTIEEGAVLNALGKAERPRRESFGVRERER